MKQLHDIFAGIPITRMPHQDEDTMKEIVPIKDWLSKQPHLPHDVRK